MENREQQIDIWERQDRWESTDRLIERVKQLRSQGLHIDAVVPLKYDSDMNDHLNKVISKAMIIVSSQTSTDGK